MKKPLLIIALLCAAAGVKAQTKNTDSVKYAKTTVERVLNNAQAIQGVIHQFHMDAVLRDRLDSLYSVNYLLLDEKINPQNYKKLEAGKKP